MGGGGWYYVPKVSVEKNHSYYRLEYNCQSVKGFLTYLHPLSSTLKKKIVGLFFLDFSNYDCIYVLLWYILLLCFIL